MFGSGVGELNVYVRPIGASSGSDQKIWGLSGDAGNTWYMAQAPVASSRPFTIVFEGIVGKNSLGNIAIDDISVAPGVCPSKNVILDATLLDATLRYFTILYATRRFCTLLDATRRYSMLLDTTLRYSMLLDATRRARLDAI
jgi:hypothetical protein